jgi:hypothetical protein
MVTSCLVAIDNNLSNSHKHDDLWNVFFKSSFTLLIWETKSWLTFSTEVVELLF